MQDKHSAPSLATPVDAATMNREGREEREDIDVEQLDIWIAVHVMGWKAIDRRAMGWGDGDIVWDTIAPDCEIYPGEEESTSPTYQGFHPSRSKEEAMMVLEKCCKKTNQVTIKELASIGCWNVKDQEGSVATAKTLPLAICLFAKALFSEAL